MAADISVRQFLLPNPEQMGVLEELGKRGNPADLDHRNRHHGRNRSLAGSSTGIGESGEPGGVSVLWPRGIEAAPDSSLRC